MLPNLVPNSMMANNNRRVFGCSLFDILLLLLLVIQPFAESQLQAKPPCRPIFVRWPRARLNSNQVTARTASLELGGCRNACAEDERDTGNALQCSAFNHRAGLSSSGGDECQLFRREHVQHTDGYVEADDRYTFYWKYCVDTEKSCTGEYAFTFLSDRYILANEVSRTKFTHSLEDCLAECLNGGGGAMLCRSVSFNRTDGGCHLSEQNQLSKPSAIRVNNNPNFRIDYYENNCYNNSFTFTSTCEPNGIRVRVDSRIPYTGALYGLYDFFSCRTEPKESKQFEHLFPYPHISKNCSDSIRIMGQDAHLEVVLSTDGVEPLYFITADDLTYQAKCPLPPQQEQKHSPSSSSSPFTKWHNNLVGGDETEAPPAAQASNKKGGPSVHSILEALSAAAEQPSIRRRFELGGNDEITAMMPKSSSSSVQHVDATGGGVPYRRADGDEQQHAHGQQSAASTDKTPPSSLLFTKDMFTLHPLYTLAEEVSSSSSSSSTTTATTTTKETTSSSSSTRTTTAPPTTITSVVVLHQGNGGQMNVVALQGRKIGMEAIFDSSSSAERSTPSTATTTTSSSSTSTTTTERHDEDELEVEDNRSTAVTFPFSTQPPTTSSGSTTTAHSAGPSTTSTTTTMAKSLASGENGTILADERVKATTKRSVADGAEMGGWPNAAAAAAAPHHQQQSLAGSSREFSFSTHLAFPPNQIWMSTGGQRPAGGATDGQQEHREETSSTSTASSSSSTDTTKTTTQQPATTTTSQPPATTTTTTSSSSTATTTKPTTTATSVVPAPPSVVMAARQQTDATTTTTATSVPTTAAASLSQTQQSVALTEPSTTASSTTTLRNTNEFGGQPPGTSGGGSRRPPQQQDKVIFDIFHNGQPTEAVVVGSRITLAFTPYFAIPPAYMSISGCQVEPIGSLYDWEKEPLAIIKDGCQADHVGLVCPPQKTDYGIRVTVESFRYQTTTQVQYTCLVRICPFAPCPQTTCSPVDGCPGDDIVSRTLGLNSRRAKRVAAAAASGATPELTLEQIRAALVGNPLLQRQLGGLLSESSSIGSASPPGGSAQPAAASPFSNVHQQQHQRRLPDAPVVGAAPTLRMNTALQQQLIVLGGDTLVRRRLVVVNSEEELRYYVKTGEVPRPAGA